MSVLQLEEFIINAFESFKVNVGEVQQHDGVLLPTIYVWEMEDSIFVKGIVAYV